MRRPSFKSKFQAMMLPGIKRWIAVMLLGMFVVIDGVLLLMGKHPTDMLLTFVKETLQDISQHVLPHSVSGVLAISFGVLIVSAGLIKMIQDVLRAYLPDDRESIPDVLYRRRHLDRGPRVVVVGGGTGLSNLLKGLKTYTHNLTAIVTVGDDGGSSGRLREELGVLPPGDIRNCITALADEEKLVTELFRYRFKSGQGLEGHSFGNLFLSAVYAITEGDMLEAVKVASRVLNSCGQVLPSSLAKIGLVAEIDDGTVIHGESKIPENQRRIVRLTCEPVNPAATPAALEAIAHAELIVIGPGSLYTSIIPNLLIKGVADEIKKSSAQKIYVCNVMTQRGETQNYSASDHVESLLKHAHCTDEDACTFVQAVLVNNQPLKEPSEAEFTEDSPTAVKCDPEKIAALGVKPEPHPLLGESTYFHHDPEKLARALMLWFYRKKNARPDSSNKSMSSTNSTKSMESTQNTGEQHSLPQAVKTEEMASSLKR